MDFALTATQRLRQHVAAAFFAIAVLSPIIWMLMDRDPPYARLSGEIIPPDPRPGDFIAVKWHVKIERSCNPQPDRNISRRVITSTGHIIDYEPVESVIDGGKSAEIHRTFQLPFALAPGPATYHSRACFSCNPIQNIWPICVDTPDLEFTIK